MNKIDLILKLVRENKITDEEAKVLMVTEKEVSYIPYYPWPSYPYYWTTPYTVTCGDYSVISNIGTTDATITLTPNATISFNATSN